MKELESMTVKLKYIVKLKCILPYIVFAKAMFYPTAVGKRVNKVWKILESRIFDKGSLKAGVRLNPAGILPVQLKRRHIGKT